MRLFHVLPFYTNEFVELSTWAVQIRYLRFPSTQSNNFKFCVRMGRNANKPLKTIARLALVTLTYYYSIKDLIRSGKLFYFVRLLDFKCFGVLLVVKVKEIALQIG